MPTTLAPRITLVLLVSVLLAAGCDHSGMSSAGWQRRSDSINRQGINLRYSIVSVTTNSESAGWRIRYILLSEDGDYGTSSHSTQTRDHYQERISFRRSLEDPAIALEPGMKICWIDKDGRSAQQAPTSLTASDLPKSFRAIRASDGLMRELRGVRNTTELEELLRRAALDAPPPDSEEEDLFSTVDDDVE